MTDELPEYVAGEPWKAAVYRDETGTVSLLIWRVDGQGAPQHAEGIDLGGIDFNDTCWFLTAAASGKADFVRGGGNDCPREDAEAAIRSRIPGVEFVPEGTWDFS